MSKITEVVTRLAIPIVEEAGVSLWDVEFVRTGGETYLRIFIDSDDGISIDNVKQSAKHWIRC